MIVKFKHLKKKETILYYLTPNKSEYFDKCIII